MLVCRNISKYRMRFTKLKRLNIYAGMLALCDPVRNLSLVSLKPYKRYRSN